MISEEDVITVQPARINYHQLSKAAVYLSSAGSQADGCLDGRCVGSHSNHHPVQLLLTSLLGMKPRLTAGVPISGQTFASQLQLGFPFLCSSFLISPHVSSLYGLWVKFGPGGRCLEQAASQLLQPMLWVGALVPFTLCWVQEDPQPPLSQANSSSELTWSTAWPRGRQDWPSSQAGCSL